MKNLTIEGTQDTPEIHLAEGEIRISGRSIPEHVNRFFDPVLDWIKEYIENPKEETKVTVSLEYANSCSFKYLSDVFKLMESVHGQKTNVVVEWVYEEDDESVLSIGEDIDSIVNYQFNFREISRARETMKKLKVKNLKTGKVADVTEKYWETIVRNGYAHDYKVLED